MRLRKNMVVRFQDAPHRVVRVTDCSALIRPTKPRSKSFVDGVTGKVVSFKSLGDGVHICSNLSESLIIAGLERKSVGADLRPAAEASIAGSGKAIPLTQA